MRPAFVVALCLALAGCATTEDVLIAPAGVRLDPIARDGAAHALEQLTEQEATSRAVTYLRGDIYGENLADITSAITETRMMSTGSNDCGPIRQPVWAFHVHAQYDGWFYLNAASGDKECSSLPFLR